MLHHTNSVTSVWLTSGCMFACLWDLHVQAFSYATIWHLLGSMLAFLAFLDMVPGVEQQLLHLW